MYPLHHKKNGIYSNISLFNSYSEVTVATRSSLYPDQRLPLQPWMSAETMSIRWAIETNPLWRPCQLDVHWDKTTRTWWVLCTIWLCYSLELNYWFIWPEQNWPPRLSLVSPKVFYFFYFCHRWSYGSLPLLPLAYLVGDTSFQAILSAWLHRYSEDITKSMMTLKHFMKIDETEWL